MIYFLLFIFGFLAFTVSTVAGGGGALMLIPLTSWLLGPAVTAPVVNLGSFLGRPVRLVLFWKSIHWNLVWRYVPLALLGALVGGWIFIQLNASWLQLVIGIFLVSTIFQYRFGAIKQSFYVPLWLFGPLGFTVSLLGTVIGGLGPLMNPFYLNYGLEKEELIATKTANSFFVGIMQIGSYSFFNALEGGLWGYGIALGLGASLGNYLGKKWLNKISNKDFRRWVVFAMVISGFFMIYRFLLEILAK